jgi:hypothetical protein
VQWLSAFFLSGAYGLNDLNPYLCRVKFRKQAKPTTNYQSPGSICWAAFLRMGALRENSPTASVSPFFVDEMEENY